MFGASSLTLRDTTATGRGYLLQADNIAFEGATSLSSNSVSGDVIVLTNRNNGPLSSFTNSSTVGTNGSGALQTSGDPARWLIFASDVTSSAFNPGALPYDFKLYNAVPGDPAIDNYAGNGLVFAQAQIALSQAAVTAKVYDGNNEANTGPISLTLSVPTDVLTGVSAVSSFFDDKNVGTNKSVTGGIVDFTVADQNGKPVYGYTLQQDWRGDITPAPLVVSGLSANNKVYDATTLATLGGTASLSPVLGSDSV
jgi:hypothetical protein